MEEFFKGKTMKCDEALRLFLSKIRVRPLEILNIDVLESLGFILAEDVYASVDVPPFDRAAMDGYAVRAEDIFSASEENPIILRIIGKSVVGLPFSGSVKSGEAVKVDTGAKMPKGTNAVVPCEFVEEKGERIYVLKSVAPYENVSKRGEDIRRGDLLLKRGIRISPWDAAILKSALVKQVKVFRRPRIAIFSCGNELVDDAREDELVNLGRVIDSSRIMIKKLLVQNYCDVIDLGIAKDEVNDIKKKILEAIKISDLLITLGGTSLGEHDLILNSLRSIKGSEIIVHGVSMRPGKPIILSTINGFPIISLPGPPVAAFLGFILFAKPTIEKISGLQGVYIPRIIVAETAKRIPSKPGIKHFVRVRVVRKDDKYFAYPIRTGGAGVLSSIVKADGLVIVPEDKEGFEVGEAVEVILLRDRIGVWDEENF